MGSGSHPCTLPQIVLDAPEELESLAARLREFVAAVKLQLSRQRAGRIGYAAFERE
ncbi:MAG: hypothetical protein ACOX6T_14575 [Myxococcales bacterium]|jgi:hypothetical protein